MSVNNYVTQEEMNRMYDKQRRHFTKNGKYFISTNDTWDRGWETMVFGRNPQTGDIDYTELDVENYNDQSEAYAGHQMMVNKWEAKN